jgi:hypothetical protein
VPQPATPPKGEPPNGCLLPAGRHEPRRARFPPPVAHAHGIDRSHAHRSMLAEPLLTPQPLRSSPFTRVLSWTAVLTVASMPLFFALLLVWTHAGWSAYSGTVLASADATSYLHGVSLGGWLLLEINPSARDEGSSPDVRPQ